MSHHGQRRHGETYNDLLTGLSNRAQLMLRLQFELAEANRQGRKLAMLHLDLDRFKAFSELSQITSKASGLDGAS